MSRYTRQDGMLLMAIMMIDDLRYYDCLNKDEVEQIRDILKTARKRVNQEPDNDGEEE